MQKLFENWRGFLTEEKESFWESEDGKSILRGYIYMVTEKSSRPLSEEKRERLLKAAWTLQTPEDSTSETKKDLKHSSETIVKIRHESESLIKGYKHYGDNFGLQRLREEGTRRFFHSRLGSRLERFEKISYKWVKK